MDNPDNSGTKIFAELSQAARDAGRWFDRIERATQTRKCEWDGQSEDGRKHREDLGREPFPWDGASDARVRTVDEVVNEQSMLMLQAFTRSRIQATGTESNDMAWGQKVTTLLKYVLWTKMKSQLRRELSLAAQWRQWFGSSVTAIMWDQQLRKMEQTVTVEGLAMVLLSQDELQNPQMVEAGVQAAQALVLDPSREEQVLKILMGLSEILTKPRARRALEELRSTGTTTIDVPEVFGAEPRITALLPMVDIFFPALTDDIQRAPWVAHREEISPEELEDRINTHGYDEEWVQAAIKARGVRFEGGGKFAARMAYWGLWNAGERATRNLVEIFHVYRRTVDDSGIPQVRCSVIHYGVPDMVGVEQRLPFEHGLYPYVVHQREHLSRPIIDSRGVAELGESWQLAQKVQIDARTDRTSVTVLPPLIVPARRGATQLRIAPGTQIPSAGRNEQYEWMRTPPYDPGSIEVESANERAIGRYFGRIHEAVPPQLTMLHQGDLVDGWTLEMRMVCSQILQLCQQYMSDDQVARITGTLSQPWQISAQDIQGQFDLSVEMDPRDLNIETLKEKWGFVEIILKYDRGGRVDYSKLMDFAMGAVDPNMAEAVLVPMEEASQKQVEDEQNNLAKMMAGIEPPMDPQPGMNYQLRAQVLQESIAKNPEMQRRIASQPDTAALIQNRMKFLQFQMAQQNNAQIGRVGTGEVLK
jgi:hypothetical protein